MATISNTPRPGYVWDATDNCWYPIGTGPHSHADYITAGSAINPNIVDAKGDIIAATAADTVARLAVGTDGQYLTAASTTSTGLQWTTLSAGGYTQLATGTLSGTQVSIGSISGSYQDLLLVVNNPYINSGATQLAFRLNGRTDNVHQSNAMRSDSNTLQTSGATSVSYATPCPNNARDLPTSSTDYVYCSMRIRNYASSNTRKVLEFTYGATDIALTGNAYFYAVDAITSIQIRTVSGTPTFSGGTYTLYGVK